MGWVAISCFLDMRTFHRFQLVQPHISSKGVGMNAIGARTLVLQRVTDPAVRLSKRCGDVPGMSGSIHWPVTRLLSDIDVYVASMGLQVLISFYRASVMSPADTRR